MIIWIDAQLSPDLAPWATGTFGVREIFQAAREAGTVVMTKDRDFRPLLEQMGPPPQILWITCGNTSNARLRDLLRGVLPIGLELLERGEPLGEISDAKL